MSVATCNIAHILISLMSWTSGLHINTLTEPRTFGRKHFLDNNHFGYENKKSNTEMELKSSGIWVCVDLYPLQQEPARLVGKMPMLE
jgi:hypothetical protein